MRILNKHELRFVFGHLAVGVAMVIFVFFQQTTTVSATEPTKAISPAMQTTLDIAQQEFRGYKPGTKEMRAKIKKAGKFASADEVEEILTGKKPDWVVVDIRKPKQALGGYIEIDGKRLLSVGRQQPSTIMGKKMMKIVDKKNIVEAAPKNIVVLCRSGMKSSFDYASYAAAGFNDVKIASIMNWAKSCRPLKTDTTILDASIKEKGYNMIQRADGLYYWDQCSK